MSTLLKFVSRISSNTEEDYDQSEREKQSPKPPLAKSILTNLFSRSNTSPHSPNVVTSPPSSPPPPKPSILSRILSRSKSDASSTHQQESSPDGNLKSPTEKSNLLTKLFSRSESLQSPSGDQVDPVASKQPFLVKLFSSGRTEQSKGNEIEKRHSLVPPNYTRIFKQRSFPLQICSTTTEWGLDTISIPDNGIRQQLTEMYVIFDNMESMPLMLTMREIELFHQWFQPLKACLQTVFELEERFLYDWIEGSHKLSAEEKKWMSPPTPLNGELSKGRRQRRKGRILQLAKEISEACSNLDGRPILQGLPCVAEHVESFVDALVDYLEAKARILPKIMEEGLRRKDRVGFEKRFWNGAVDLVGSETGFLVGIVDTWLERRFWCLGLPTRVRREISGWEGAFGGRREIVARFERRVGECCRERERLVRMNDSARARVFDDKVCGRVASESLGEGGMTDVSSSATRV